MSSRRQFSDIRRKPASARPRHAEVEIVGRPGRGRKRLAWRRRRAKILLVGGIILLFGGVTGGALGLTHLDRLQVNGIEVEGTEQLSPKLVETLAETVLYDGSLHPISRTSIFLYPRSEISHALEMSFPRIKSASVAKTDLLAQAVRITIEEREPAHTWCAETGECYVMDDDGFLFAPAEEIVGYRFSGGVAGHISPIGQSFLRGYLPEVESVLKLLSSKGYPVVGADVRDERDYMIQLSSGPELYVSFGEDPLTIVKNLTTALSSAPLQGEMAELSYIDLRYGNRVYFKKKGGATEAAPSASPAAVH